LTQPRITAAMVAGGRTLAESRLSPDGRTVGFLASSRGGTDLVVVDLEGGPERVITTDPAPVRSHPSGGGAWDWLPDGRGVVYAGAAGGLFGQAVAGGPPQRLVDAARVGSVAVSPDGTRVAYVVDTREVATAPTSADGAWPVRLSAGADFALDPAWSADGQWVAWHEWDVPDMPWDRSRLAARPADGSGERISPTGGGTFGVAQPRFSPDGQRLGYLSDETGWRNLWSVGRSLDDHAVLVPEAAEHGGPTWGPGARTWAWAPDSAAVALAVNEQGFGALDVVDRSGSRRRLGRGVHVGLSWAGGRLVALQSGARTPTELVVYEGEGLAGRRTVASGPVAGFEAAGLVEPELVEWPGDDGAPVPGRLYRPLRPAAGEPPPLIAWVHGGPTDQWGVSFLPRIAYWQERGWAVLLVDHRGSTGHGRAFQTALHGRWGEVDTADVAAGLRAAGARGWGDPARMVVMGGSAGGFTVLNVLASHPDLCAAGVDLYGVADLFTLAETTHRYEAHYLDSLVGPLPEAAARYRERSPVHRADAIGAPLLLLQGADDEVVPPAQCKAIADRLRARGGEVELHVYEGEGHGWSKPETVVDELQRTEAFLRRHVLRVAR
jgi:dipeptidyl aminopeptidase/acylaminoacyl peptidase